MEKADRILACLFSPERTFEGNIMKKSKSQMPANPGDIREAFLTLLSLHKKCLERLLFFNILDILDVRDADHDSGTVSKVNIITDDTDYRVDLFINPGKIFFP
jgi:hypothetical protein